MGVMPRFYRVSAVVRIPDDVDWDNGEWGTDHLAVAPMRFGGQYHNLHPQADDIATVHLDAVLLEGSSAETFEAEWREQIEEVS